MLGHGPAKRVTICVGEDVHHRGESLYMAILNFLFYRGVAGATVTNVSSTDGLLTATDGGTGTIVWPMTTPYQFVGGNLAALGLRAALEVGTGDIVELERKLELLEAADFLAKRRRKLPPFLEEHRAELGGNREPRRYRQTGVPYVRPERMFGRTTNSLLKNIAWARKGIFSFSYQPLELISWLALVTLVSLLRQDYPLLVFPALVILGWVIIDSAKKYADRQ